MRMNIELLPRIFAGRQSADYFEKIEIVSAEMTSLIRRSLASPGNTRKQLSRFS